MTYDKLIVAGPLIQRLQFSLPPRVAQFSVAPQKSLGETDLEFAEIYRDWKESQVKELEKKGENLAARREEKRLINSLQLIPDPARTAPSIQRARSKLRRLVYVNAWQYRDKRGVLIPPKFLTLTFKENIQDLRVANRIFSKYIQVFNDQFRNILVQPLKYVCAPEFQDRGAVHYHLIIFNFPFMHKVFSKIRSKYTDRFELKTLSREVDTERVLAYVSKYISKQTSDGRFWGQKRYFSSVGLKQPAVIVNDPAIDIITGKIAPFFKYEFDFEVDFCGIVHMQVYYLGDHGFLKPQLFDPDTRRVLELALQGKKKDFPNAFDEKSRPITQKQIFPNDHYYLLPKIDGR